MGALMHTAGKEVIVRRLQAHEHAAYRTVRLECLRLNPDLFGTTYPEASAMPILTFERFISTGDRDNVMFGAFVDGWLCGLCGFARETRQRTRHRGELVQMYVHTTLTRRRS